MDIKPSPLLRPAVFLDRDGTLVKDAGYLKHPDQLELLAGAVEGLKLLRRNGFALVIVSNQSGVGRGFLTQADHASVHLRLIQMLAAQGVMLDGAYYCLHAPWDGCDCRKPAPGLLLRAARDLNLDLSRSYVVGDKPSDILAGSRTGCFTLLLSSEVACERCSEKCLPSARAPDFLSAARWICTRYFAETEITCDEEPI